MDIDDSGSSMSFVLPSAYHMDKLPKPNDSGVKLKTTEDEDVAAVTFRGYASDKQIKSYSEKLERLLENQGIPYTGNFRFLWYNPPY